jgi:hypothetical protein
MSRKKKVQVRARKVKSSGVWIAPDLERKIKGEGGRRGLTEPPYSYYLRLADLALKSSEPAEQPSQPTRPALPFPDPLLRTPPTRSTSDVTQTSGVTHQARRPIPVRPKPPQLTLPKPPKAPQPPKPAKRAQITPLRRPAPQKLSIPKPPKRPKRG